MDFWQEIAKKIKKGWRVTGREVAALLSRCLGIDAESWDEVERELSRLRSVDHQASLKTPPFGSAEPEPISMILMCPACGERHYDVGEFATKPHHTHACQECGFVWRPAVVPTLGVRFLPGFRN
jgi:predicted RNA-binding Zn-ribbon protein involved in translation (DUF1610 family)